MESQPKASPKYSTQPILAGLEKMEDPNLRMMWGEEVIRRRNLKTPPGNDEQQGKCLGLAPLLISYSSLVIIVGEQA